MKRNPSHRKLISSVRHFGGTLKRRFLDLRIRIDRQVPDGRNRQPFPIVVEYKAAFAAPRKPEILLFGDSVYQRVSRADEDKRKLGAMIADAMPDRVVHATSFSAYTSYMFEPLLALAARLGGRPAHVVLPFNLRCLSPQWDGCPLWQYVQDHAIVQAQIADPAADPAPKFTIWEDWEFYRSIRFSSPLTPRTSIGEFRDLTAGRVPGVEPETRRRELLVQHYGMLSRPGHRQIMYLRAAIEAALDLGAHVTVYLTPLNVDHIRETGGDALLAIVRANADIVLSAARSFEPTGRVGVHDWSEALAADHFFHRQETTEHLQASGREALTSRLVGAIRANDTAYTERMAS